MAFFLHRSKANKPLHDDEKLRQDAMRASQQVNDARTIASETLVPSDNEPAPKKNSATVDIMAKRSVDDGPYRPPRTFEDPEYGKIEIHFGCLPGGDVELPSDDERDEEENDNDDNNDNDNDNNGTAGGAEHILPSVKKTRLAPPPALNKPTSSSFGLQMQETVTHFRMNIGDDTSSTASSSSSSSSSSPTSSSASHASSTSISSSSSSNVRPDLVTTGGRVGDTRGTGGTGSGYTHGQGGPSLYDQMMTESQVHKQKGRLDPDTHSVTVIRETDIAPSRRATSSVLSSSSLASTPTTNNETDTETKTGTATGTPFILAPVQTLTEEMVRISELRRDHPNVAKKIMMQGSLLVDLAAQGGSTDSVASLERLFAQCKPGEFLQWHIVKALQCAATEGHLEIVRMMVRHGAPLRGPDGKPLGILEACVESGAEHCGEVIRYLVTECNFSVDYSTPPEYYTHLHDACMRLDYPTVALLVELGAGVNSIAADDSVPLSLVLSRAKAATPPMHVLTRTGAEVAAFQRSGQPQMAVASAAMLKQAKQIEELLRKKGARPTWRRE